MSPVPSWPRKLLPQHQAKCDAVTPQLWFDPSLMLSNTIPPETSTGCSRSRSWVLDNDAVVIVDVFAKKTQATPAAILATGRERLRQYDRVTQSER